MENHQKWGKNHFRRNTQRRECFSMLSFVVGYSPQRFFKHLIIINHNQFNFNAIPIFGVLSLGRLLSFYKVNPNPYRITESVIGNSLRVIIL